MISTNLGAGDVIFHEILAKADGLFSRPIRGKYCSTGCEPKAYSLFIEKRATLWL